MARTWTDVTAPGGWAWEDIAPGPQLARILAETDLTTLAPIARPSYLAAATRLEGWAQMLTCQALVNVADAVLEEVGESTPWQDEGTQAWVAEEIAAALHVAPGTATNRLLTAEQLVREMPTIGEHIATGSISMSQGRAVAESVRELRGLTDDTGTDLVQKALARILPRAAQMAPARLREFAAKVVITLAPEGAAERRREARRHGADVSLWRDHDAMATLAMKSDAPDAIALRQIIHTRALQMREEGSLGSLGQLRVAAMMEAFGLLPIACLPEGSDQADSTDAQSLSVPLPYPLPSPQPHNAEIKVIVDLPTLLGLADKAGHLDGYGPIDPDLARALAEDGQWQRWVTDPVTGYLLDEGDRRFPGARLARYIKARDTHCSHPACGVRARHADIDHVPEYRVSHTTSADTLTSTCSKHNRGRDGSGWTVTTWTSPLGRAYRCHNIAHHGDGDGDCNGPTPS